MASQPSPSSTAAAAACHGLEGLSGRDLLSSADLSAVQTGALLRLAAAAGTSVEVLHDPVATVHGAHALYTDVWASMGQEDEKAERERAFAGWCLDEDLIAEADSRAIVLHCLPAYRGLEISAGAIEGASSRVFDQAENRLHAQQALLAALLSPEATHLAS